MTTPDDNTPREPLTITPPPAMDARMHLALPLGAREVLEDMARETGFKGRHPGPDFIRAILMARIQHDRPEDYKRIRGAA